MHIPCDKVESDTLWLSLTFVQVGRSMGHLAIQPTDSQSSCPLCRPVLGRITDLNTQPMSCRHADPPPRVHYADPFCNATSRRCECGITPCINCNNTPCGNRTWKTNTGVCTSVSITCPDINSKNPGVCTETGPGLSAASTRTSSAQVWGWCCRENGQTHVERLNARVCVCMGWRVRGQWMEASGGHGGCVRI